MNVSRGVIGALAFSLGISSCQSSQSKMTFEQEGDSLTVIHITNPTQYLLFARRGEDSRSTGLHCFGLGSR